MKDLQTEWSEKCKCWEGCGSTLMVEESDLFKVFARCNEGNEDVVADASSEAFKIFLDHGLVLYVVFACCKCGKWNGLNTKYLPPGLLSRIPQVTGEQKERRRRVDAQEN